MPLAVIYRYLWLLQVPPKATLSFQHCAVLYPQGCHSRPVCGPEERLAHALQSGAHQYAWASWGLSSVSAPGFTPQSCKKLEKFWNHLGGARSWSKICRRRWLEALYWFHQQVLGAYSAKCYCATLLFCFMWGRQGHQIPRTRVIQSAPKSQQQTPS